MRIEVAGIPAPQGSKVRTPQGGLRESSRAVGPWREAVRAETQRAYERTDIDRMRWLLADHAAVAAEISFRLPRPKSAPKKVRWPVRRPDLDKLLRATLDGLVMGHALEDDSQVVHMIVTKQFADDLHRPGCVIYLYPPMEADDASDGS